MAVRVLMRNLGGSLLGGGTSPDLLRSLGSVHRIILQTCEHCGGRKPCRDTVSAGDSHNSLWLYRFLLDSSAGSRQLRLGCKDGADGRILWQAGMGR